MSIVGPRPPIASEVREYKLNHLRRLDVTPGITGLWQVAGAAGSFVRSIHLAGCGVYRNWSIWLDMKIIIRTVAWYLLDGKLKQLTVFSDQFSDLARVPTVCHLFRRCA